MKRILLFLTLAAAPLLAVNEGNAPVTKKTVGNLINEDLVFGSGRTLNLSAGTFNYATGSAFTGNLSEFRADIGLAIGTNVQAWDADLDIFATYTPTTLPVSIQQRAAMTETRQTVARSYSQTVAGTGLSGGGTTSIVIVGDSLVYGSIGSGGVASPKLAESLQATLRTHYGTSTVINVGGLENPAATTQNYLDGSITGAGWTPEIWSTTVQTSGADVFIIFLGMNDAVTLTVEQYRTNLRRMALLAIDAGKMAIIASPSFSSYAADPSEKLASFSQASREVAEALNLQFIDAYGFVQRYAAERNKFYVHADGVHPQQALYDLLAVQFAQPFVAASHVKSGDTLSAMTSNAVYTSASVVNTSISRFGGMVQCDTASVAFVADEDRSDVILHLGRASEYSDNIKVTVDGVQAYAALDTAGDGLSTAGSFFSEFPIFILDKLPRGFHVVKIERNDSKPIAFSALSFQRSPGFLSDGIGSAEVLFPVVSAVNFTAPAGQKVILLDRVLNMRTGVAFVEFDADLSASFFGVGTAGFGETGIPLGDLFVFAVPAAFNLRLFKQGEAISQVDYPTGTAVTGKKRIRLKFGVSAVECFVDGVSYGSVSTDRAIIGGWLCIWTNASSGRVENISVSP